jgi:hypothetical protein
MKDENQTSTIDERRQKDLFHVENEEKNWPFWPVSVAGLGSGSIL